MNITNKYAILIIDDSRLNILALSKILSADYSLFAAKSGAEGLAIAAKNRPDLILLDLMMPEMDGYEVFRRLLKQPETRDIPVIFVTSSPEQDNEEAALIMGAADYIIKPFSEGVIKARVRTQLKIIGAMREISRLTTVDGLTGIANRRGLNERLELEWARGLRECQPFSLLLLDIDDFKHYNDTYGHQQGDLLLMTLAQIFAVSVTHRKTDFAARYGGEEFCVILPNTELVPAKMIAERIRLRVEATKVPAITDSTILTGATVSIGVACTIPGNVDTFDEVIMEADRNLYIAKAEGKNCIRAAFVEKGETN
ncbi:MAG: diguanylate cyclase [Oscillospiraceae bacterium]|nr:diguanylate cyclase [Oscillospiraceae bacterium]